MSKEKINPFESETIHKILLSLLNAEHDVDRDKEHFWAIGCSSSYIQVIELVSLGTWNLTLASPREAFRLAMMKGCPNIIFAHNHPSGRTEPSERDIQITRVLWEIGSFHNLNVLDHLVITEETYFSFVESDLVFNEKSIWEHKFFNRFMG